MNAEVQEILQRELWKQLRKRLHLVGPGYAIGYRLTPNQHDPVTWPTAHQPLITWTWNFHKAKLMDGEVHHGMNGFTYVQFKEDAA